MHLKKPSAKCRSFRIVVPLKGVDKGCYLTLVLVHNNACRFGHIHMHHQIRHCFRNCLIAKIGTKPFSKTAQSLSLIKPPGKRKWNGCRWFFRERYQCRPVSSSGRDKTNSDDFNSSPSGQNGRHFGRRHCQLHWFRQWLGAEQATSYYLDQWWPSSLTHICVTRGRWVNVYQEFYLVLMNSIR